MSELVVRRTRRTVVVALALLSVTAPALPAAQAGNPVASVRQDFNGDGYEDLAVAAPDGTVNGKAEAGYVAVLFGSAHGLGGGGKKVYSQASAGVPGSPEKGDRFGTRLDAADLDADGFTDLVVETQWEKLRQDGVDRSGSRTVLWGGRSGFGSGTVLSAVGSERYQRGVTATGDFDGDGHQDLFRLGRMEFGPFGRDGRPASVQDGVPLVEEDQSLFDVTAGDVDGDGITDLVAYQQATEPDSNEDWPAQLNYARGSHDGLLPFTVLEDAPGHALKPGGTELSLGDLNGDDRADLVIGGQVLNIFYGTANGPDTTRHVIGQDTPGVPGTQEPLDYFGGELSIGDVDGDGYGDILAGDAEEAVGTRTAAGSVAVVPGGPHGPTGAGTKVFTQNSADVPGSAEKHDEFGRGVRLVDGNADGRAEAVVGAPGEDSGAGAVWVFPATSSGVTAKGSFTFRASTLGTVAAGGRLGNYFTN